MANNSPNGRVNIMQPNSSILFSMKDKIPPNNKSSAYKDAMTGGWYNTDLSNAYFSAKNIASLQNGIRVGVLNRSNGLYKIGNQNEDQLKIVMRSVFLQYAQNLPYDLTNQIKNLNYLVLDYCIGQVFGEAKGYMKYQYDASYMYEPLTTPVSSNYKKSEILYPPPF